MSGKKVGGGGSLERTRLCRRIPDKQGIYWEFCQILAESGELPTINPLLYLIFLAKFPARQIRARNRRIWDRFLGNRDQIYFYFGHPSRMPSGDWRKLQYRRSGASHTQNTVLIATYVTWLVQRLQHHRCHSSRRQVGCLLKPSAPR